MSIDKQNAQGRLAMLGFELTKPAAPAANYLPTAQSGNLIFISGQLSTDKDGIVKGTLGKDMNIEQGQNAARHCALSVLSQIVHSAGIELDDIKSITKITVLVCSTTQFFDHHLVANGASDLLATILGDKGKHARAAFGVAALPLGAAVEIEAIIEV